MQYCSTVSDNFLSNAVNCIEASAHKILGLINALKVRPRPEKVGV